MKYPDTHSLEFRKALVDEALNRTPQGGIPELEQRHHLPPGTLFDWFQELGSQPPTPFSALHFWIGNTTLDEVSFGRYFEHAESYLLLTLEDLENSPENLTGCGFCQDIQSRYFYDEDLLLVVLLPEPVTVADIVSYSTLVSDDSLAQIISTCATRGIHQANAMFVYADPTEEITEPEKLYNGLPYIGLFDD